MFGIFGKKSGAKDPNAALKRGDLDAALTAYREQLRKEPLKAATLNKRIAETAIQAGRTQEAVEAYLAAAVALQQDHRKDQALALCKTAMRYDPHNAQLIAKLAELAIEPVKNSSAGAPKMTMRSKLRAYVPLFSEFSAEEFSAIVDCMRLHRLDANHTVFQQGDVGESLYIISQGAVTLTVAGHNGDSVELERLKDGAVFGEVSALDRSPRNMTATTAKPSELLELGRDYLEALSIEHPHIWEVLESFQKTRRMPVGV